MLAKLLLVLLVVLALGGCRPAPTLEGAWVSSDGAARTTLAFSADGRGRRVSPSGMDDFRYSVDYERDPIAVDLDFNGEPGEVGVVRGIVRFRGDTEMELLLAPAGTPRPPLFGARSRGSVFSRAATR